MSRSLRLSRSAERDIEEARRWYAEEAPHMEMALGEEIDATLQRIADHSKLYQRVEGEVRRAVLRRFPFSVFYREVSDWIEIVSVVHQARDPRTWQERIARPQGRGSCSP